MMMMMMMMMMRETLAVNKGEVAVCPGLCNFKQIEAIGLWRAM